LFTLMMMKYFCYNHIDNEDNNVKDNYESSENADDNKIDKDNNNYKCIFDYVYKKKNNRNDYSNYNNVKRIFNAFVYVI